MLKKKMQHLAKAKNLSDQSKFEVINDSSASEVLGGVRDCPNLVACGTFDGTCPNLSSCGTYGQGPTCPSFL